MCHERLLCGRARQVWPRGEELARLCDRGLGVVAAGDARGLVAYGKRVGDAEPPAALVGVRGPGEVEAPAVAERRGREQRGGGPPAAEGGRADLDEAGLAQDRERRAPRDPPRRMARERLDGLGDFEPEVLGEPDEAVEEARGED